MSITCRNRNVLFHKEPVVLGVVKEMIDHPLSFLLKEIVHNLLLKGGRWDGILYSRNESEVST
jgi:hypothetical protein